MNQPIKYLSAVSQIISLYQNEIITLIKHASLSSNAPDLSGFKTKLDKEIALLKQIEDDKSINDYKISDICDSLAKFLDGSARPKHTSQSDRYALRSSLRTQDSHRMRFTGGLTRKYFAGAETINESSETDELIKSYKVEEEIGPRMRMKWKSLKNGETEEEQTGRRTERSTIGDNNIDLLSYTIPEIENSIKRLSLQSVHSKQRSPQKIFEVYRTVDTRAINRKKFVARLI